MKSNYSRIKCLNSQKVTSCYDKLELIITGTGGARAETKRAGSRREPCARPRTRSDGGPLLRAAPPRFTIVIPIIEYCGIIWNLSQIHDIRSVEKIPRGILLIGSLTWVILTIGNVWNIWMCSLLSAEGKRYFILFSFKIIFWLVPNPGISWYVSERRGRMLSVPPSQHRLSKRLCAITEGTLLFCLSPRLFNCLPKEIKNLPNCNINNVKHYVDEFLHRILRLLHLAIEVTK